MLPILRILPVGGVLLAIVLLVLALNPPAGRHVQLTRSGTPVLGAMIERSEHPEWRQFLMLAAIRRANELNRLRELPDTPVIAASPAPKTEPKTEPQVAVLPTEQSGTDPDDNDDTGPLSPPTVATIPVDIGEPSTFELPVAAPEEKPPIVRTPHRARSRNEERVRRVRHARRVKPPAPVDVPPPFNLFEMLFGGGSTTRQPLKVGANTTAR
jgi:hypothetical protein